MSCSRPGDPSQPQPRPRMRKSMEVHDARQTSLALVFKRMKTALQKIRSPEKDRKQFLNSNLQATANHNVESTMMDQAVETKPPLEHLVSNSAGLEVDSEDDAPALEFTKMPEIYTSNPARRERMSALLTKYGLAHDMDTRLIKRPDSAPPALRLRMEKKARLRVRSACHECSTTFRGTGTCIGCGHIKCDDCGRSTHSVRRSTDEPNLPEIDTDMISMASSVHTNEAEHRLRAHDDRSLLAVDRDPAKHVCHACGHDFPSQHQEAKCSYCSHEKCGECLRFGAHVLAPHHEGIDLTTCEPSRADRVYRPPKQRVRHHCHRCGALFSGKSALCRDCLHERCIHCPRFPTKPRRRRPRSTIASASNPRFSNGSTFASRTESIGGNSLPDTPRPVLNTTS